MKPLNLPPPCPNDFIADCEQVGDCFNFNITPTPGSDLVDTITLQYRCEGTTNYLPVAGLQICNPGCKFTVQITVTFITDREDCQTVVRAITKDPCGNKVECEVQTFYDNGDLCALLVPLVTTIYPFQINNLLYTINGGTAQPVPASLIVCGLQPGDKICFNGEVVFEADCDPLPLECCLDVPQEPTDCTHNLVLECFQVSPGMYIFTITGTSGFDILKTEIYYKCPGDVDFTLWDGNPINCEPIEIIALLYTCDCGIICLEGECSTCGANAGSPTDLIVCN